MPLLFCAFLKLCLEDLLMHQQCTLLHLPLPLLSPIRYQDIVAKPVYTLKRHRLIPTETDPAVHLLSYLDCPQSVQAEILSRLPLHYTVTMNLRDVKRSVLRSYLSWRLQCSPDRINTLIGKYPSIENRSLQFLRRTIEIVTNNFNFPLKKVVCLKML